MDRCSICLFRIRYEAVPYLMIGYKLICGHPYHLGCIRTWFLKSRRCPYCRRIHYIDFISRFPKDHLVFCDVGPNRPVIQKHGGTEI